MTKLQRKQERALRKLSIHRWKGRPESLSGHMTAVDVLVLVKMGFRLKGGRDLWWIERSVSKGELRSCNHSFDLPKKELFKLLHEDIQQ